MFLFFSVARSQESGSWERADQGPFEKQEKAPRPVSKAAAQVAFGTNMPLMSSAFDTAMWLNAA